MLDIGIYPAFLAYMCLGKPERAQSIIQRSESGVDRMVSAQLSYPDGRQAQLHASFAGHSPTEAYLAFDKGYLRLARRWHMPTELYISRNGEQEQAFPLQWRGNGYNYEIDECFRCLSHGLKESPRWGWKDSEELMSIIELILSGK